MLLGIWYHSINQRVVKKLPTAGSAANGLPRGFDGKSRCGGSVGLGIRLGDRLVRPLRLRAGRLHNGGRGSR